jgi:hypothetical protein
LEGLTVVKGCRDRSDGYKRNPYDEYECGHHYARAMSSYGLLLVLSGFTYDKTKDYLGFAPKLFNEDFKTFWALDNAWGQYSQTTEQVKLEVLWGSIVLQKITLRDFADKTLEVKYKDQKWSLTCSSDGLIEFPDKIEIGINEYIDFYVENV